MGGHPGRGRGRPGVIAVDGQTMLGARLEGDAPHLVADLDHGTGAVLGQLAAANRNEIPARWSPQTPCTLKRETATRITDTDAVGSFLLSREPQSIGLRGRHGVSPTVGTCPGNAGVGRPAWDLVLVPYRRLTARRRIPYTLAAPAPRVLGLLDQLGLWGNLGVSLLGFTGAIFVLVPVAAPGMSLGAALTALLVGTVLGALGLGAAAVPGAQTGAPSMVLLRGLFGTRPSYLPTVVNVVQLWGWATFELVMISTALHQLAPGAPVAAFAIGAGLLTTALALRPLAWIRVLRRYVTLFVVGAMVYLGAQLLTQPLPSLVTQPFAFSGRGGVGGLLGCSRHRHRCHGLLGSVGR